MDERNFTYMFYGFAAAWLILALYVVTLVAREKNLRREIDTLRKLVERRETQ
jgi:CcmD family protein